jgi:hypothetical protein
MDLNALTIIKRALDLVGVTGSGEVPSANDIDTMFFSLNMIIDSWDADRLWGFTTETHTVIGFMGNTCTIGPGAQVAVIRPESIEDTCFSRIGNVDYPIKMIDGASFTAIPNKILTGLAPQFGYYEPDTPVGKLLLWPQPSSPVDLYIRVQFRGVPFPNIYNEYFFPSGYGIALIYSLAELGYSIYSRPVDPNVVRIASNARKVLRKNNRLGKLLSLPTSLY